MKSAIRPRRFALGCLAIALVVLLPSARQPTPARAETVRGALGLAADPAIDARRAGAVARATARCMTGRGWRFSPVAEPGPPIPDADLAPIPWAARWGFGVSTATLMPPPSSEPDPNLVRLAAAPAATRAAFLADLHGRAGSVGCAERAATTIYGARDRILEPLRGPFATLAAAIASDPGLATAIEAWRDCVPAFDGSESGPSADALEGLDRGAYGTAAIAWYARRSASIADDPVALGDLQAQERLVASAAARCEAAYAVARGSVAARHEAPFVARHRSTLAALGAEIRRVEDGYPVVLAAPP